MTNESEERRRILEAIEALEAIEDDAHCTAEVSAALKDWPQYQKRLRELRQRRVQALRGQGKSWKEIASIIGGITPARAQQIGQGLSGAVRRKQNVKTSE
ncbi:hypothetical protein JJV70_15165 [Streptomyces sp. JJ66]|nr:hypothetical protein [Streptomyces sp. JJ66]